MSSQPETQSTDVMGIVKTPGVLGGKARLRNDRIAVAHIAAKLDKGQSIEEVARGYHIAPRKVKQVQTYWIKHPEEIRATWDHAGKVEKRMMEDSRVHESLEDT